MSSLVSEYFKLEHASAANKVKDNISSLAGGDGGGGGDYDREERYDLTGNYESANSRDNKKGKRRAPGEDGYIQRQQQLQQEAEKPIFCFKSFSFKQRLIGFIIVACIGFVFCIFSWVTAFRKLYGTFAVIYTVANVVLLLSTILLCGPLTQIKNLKQMHRLIPLLLFFIFLIVNYIVALAAKIAGLTILFVVLQLLAMTWYCLSYIPQVWAKILNCLPCWKRN